VRNLPRTALHRPSSDLGYGLPSLKAHAAQLTACHLHKIMNTSGYRGRPPAAQWRRPRRGCARTPVGTYLYLHAVGADNSVAVPGLAR
jgi:hypothetical protein